MLKKCKYEKVPWPQPWTKGRKKVNETKKPRTKVVSGKNRS